MNICLDTGAIIVLSIVGILTLSMTIAIIYKMIRTIRSLYLSDDLYDD